jgi:hypothetical protein
MIKHAEIYFSFRANLDFGGERPQSLLLFLFTITKSKDAKTLTRPELIVKANTKSDDAKTKSRWLSSSARFQSRSFQTNACHPSASSHCLGELGAAITSATSAASAASALSAFASGASFRSLFPAFLGGLSSVTSQPWDSWCHCVHLS